MTYTGATISNFLLNATAGILIVAMMLVQVGRRNDGAAGRAS